MNKEETLALYSQGKEVWNAWAKENLARCDDTQEWRSEAEVDFRSHTFPQDTDFSGFIFPGRAQFDGAYFEDTAEFSEATFYGTAEFREATFCSTAEFREATFEDTAGFEGMIFWGNAVFDKATFKGRSQFNKATFKGFADFGWARFENEALFDKATFEEFASFWEARFKNLAEFHQATFKSNAMFTSAAFKGDAEFWGATFKWGAAFGRARFEGEAVFEEVPFEGTALFWEAIFERTARFGLSTFEHSTTFYGAKFLTEADFKAVQGNSVFTMADAEFIEVPDFQQATFVQAPRLDNVRIGPQPSRWDKLKAFFIKGDSERAGRWRALGPNPGKLPGHPLPESERPGRWRALRRLATQGHDHASEQLFFRGELLARRGVTDRYWQASFWLGVFYQIFSDFGRSLIRPLLWWTVGVLVFAGVYLSHHPRGDEWLTLECIAGTGKPWVSALGLSLHRSLPALSGFRDTLPQFHACLYGVQSENPFRPIIPDVVSFLSVPQVLFSAVMIFLFLLAVRNHFRIR